MAKKKKRKRSQSSSLRTLLWLALLLGGGYLLLRPSVGELQKEQRQLRALLQNSVARDPSLLGVPRTDVVVGLRWRYAQRLVEQLTERVLDRTPLHLSGIRVNTRGDVKAKLLLGRVRVGSWRLRLDVREAGGVLRTGRPRVAFTDQNRADVIMPMSLEGGRASASVHFLWDARRFSSLVCRDFDVVREVEGDIVPLKNDLKGELVLSTEGEAVIVKPRIRSSRLRLRVRPSARSWARARAAMKAQDTFWKCGVGLNPDAIMDDLRKIVDRGFDVKMPEIAPGAIRVPIRFRRHLGAGSERIELRLGERQIYLTRGAIWYGASIVSQKSPVMTAASQDGAALVTPDEWPEPTAETPAVTPEPTPASVTEPQAPTPVATRPVIELELDDEWVDELDGVLTTPEPSQSPAATPAVTAEPAPSDESDQHPMTLPTASP